MDRERERSDLLSTTTDASYKCAQCGNMYPVDQENCDVCGYECSQDACQIVQVSNEGY